MGEHQAITTGTGMPIYFCEPRAVRGRAVVTRTPTVRCDSASPKERISARSAKLTWTPTSTTPAGRPTAIAHNFSLGLDQ